jgi:hypothetical protein
MVTYFTKYPILYPTYPYWLGISLLFAFVMIVSVPRSLYSWSTVKAMCYVPLLVFSMVKALFSMKVSRKEFLHTPKVHTGD